MERALVEAYAACDHSLNLSHYTVTTTVQNVIEDATGLKIPRTEIRNRFRNIRKRYAEVALLGLDDEESAARFPLFVEVRNILDGRDSRVIGSRLWLEHNRAGQSSASSSASPNPPAPSPSPPARPAKRLAKNARRFSRESMLRAIFTLQQQANKIVETNLATNNRIIRHALRRDEPSP